MGTTVPGKWCSALFYLRDQSTRPRFISISIFQTSENVG